MTNSQQLTIRQDAEGNLEVYLHGQKLYETDTNYWLGLGMFEDHTENYEAALFAYKKAYEMDESSIFTLKCIATLYRQLYLFKNALPVYKRIVQLDDTDDEAWADMGEVHQRIRQYSDSLFAYKKAVKLNKNNTKHWYGKGLAHLLLDEANAALSSFDNAIRLDKNNAYAYHGKGNVYTLMGRDDDALSAYNQAISLDETFAEPWLSISEIQISNHQYDEVKRSLFAGYKRIRRLDAFDFFYTQMTKSIDHINSPLFLKRIGLEHGGELLAYSSWGTLMDLHRFDLETTKGIRDFLEDPETICDELEKSKICGMLNYYLGDPFQAYEDFGKLKDEHESDLFGQYYLVQSLWILGESHSSVLESALKPAIETLANPKKSTLENLFYAGLLFEIAKDYEKARQAFSYVHQKDDIFLAAKYMMMLCCHHLGDDHDKKLLANEILKFETTHKGGPGFLGEIGLMDIELSLDGIQKPFVKYARALEISGAIQVLLEFVNAYIKQYPDRATWLKKVGYYEAKEPSENKLQALLGNEKLQQQLKAFKKKKLGYLESNVYDCFPEFLATHETSEEPSERLSARISDLMLQTRKHVDKSDYQHLVFYFFYNGKLTEQDCCILLYYTVFLFDRERLEIIPKTLIGKTVVTAEALLGSFIFTDTTYVLVKFGLFLTAVSALGRLAEYINQKKEKSSLSKLSYEKFRLEFLTFLSKKLKIKDKFFAGMTQDMQTLAANNEEL